MNTHKCSKCGEEIEPNANFCTKCGYIGDKKSSIHKKYMFKFIIGWSLILSSFLMSIAFLLYLDLSYKMDITDTSFPIYLFISVFILIVMGILILNTTRKKIHITTIKKYTLIILIGILSNGIIFMLVRNTSIVTGEITRILYKDDEISIKITYDKFKKDSKYSSLDLSVDSTSDSDYIIHFNTLLLDKETFYFEPYWIEPDKKSNKKYYTDGSVDLILDSNKTYETDYKYRRIGHSGEALGTYKNIEIDYSIEKIEPNGDSQQVKENNLKIKKYF